MRHSNKHYLTQWFVIACATLLLGGCASTGNPKDPAEGFNRAMYSFNDGLDTVFMKPVAKGYDAVLPTPVKDSVLNFFANLNDLSIAINNLLQAKPAEAISDLGRFFVNTTLGVFGLFDVASAGGMEKHDEDFGQTLGRWGAGPGAYLFWPVIGPRNVRDTAGVIVDLWFLDPIVYEDNVSLRNSAIGLRFFARRAELLPADKVIEEAALDKYAYMRDAYLQSRQNLVYDGNPPRNLDDY